MSNDDLRKIIFEGLDDITVKKIDRMAEQVKLAIGLVARLRGPKGCPWDREQTHQSLRQYLIEEAYEVLDVLDLDPLDHRLLREELGDLLLQILLHSQLTDERSEFSFGDVCEQMAAKLVSRHPHVFGDLKLDSSHAVLANWESIKKKEGKKKLLSGLPKNLPSLQRAARIGEKVRNVGFDWKDWQGAWDKVKEETQELHSAIGSGNKDEIEHELGDLFFSICNLARHLKLTPEDAHRKAIARFESRFSRVEEICEVEGIDMSKADLEVLDEVWNRVKKEMSK